MYPPDINIPHGDEVTTEPQRQALEAMSRDLVQKLNTMVAEQERRAREFAAQQHSLSSLPSFSLPEITPATPLQPDPTPAPAETATYTQSTPAPQQSITNGPRLPQVPQPATQPRQRTAWDESFSSPRQQYKMPTIIREQAERKESSIGAGTIATIIFILFILIMHGCE